MRYDLVNNLQNCPDKCNDADITVEHSELGGLGGCKKVRIILDCEHSGVCAKKGCNAYFEIAKSCAVSPGEVMGIQDALQDAVNAAHLTRPGEEEGAVRSMSNLIASGITERDGLLLAQKIACYGSVEKWLEARDAKKELDNGEA